MKLWMLAAILICGATMLSCGNKNAGQTQEAEAPQEEVVAEEATVLSTIDDYLVNEIGKHYAPGEYCIPYSYIVYTDESNSEDIRVWGDYWVFLYNLSGDTLKTVSGGSHPGLMHLRKMADGYEVTAFDAVEDGSNNLPSAKRIFGEHYDAFHAINSDGEAREKNRMQLTADYVKKHQIKATMVQDYGWPAKKLPLE